MLLTRPPLSLIKFIRRCILINFARLACVRHAASVRPEPGSNSHVKILSWLFQASIPLELLEAFAYGVALVAKSLALSQLPLTTHNLKSKNFATSGITLI